MVDEGSIYRPGRSGGMLLRNMEEILHDEKVKNALDNRVITYYRTLFTDQRGWNLRNDVCHGILRAEMYTRETADRTFHAALLLGAILLKDKDN